MNRVFITGNLTRDPETSQTSNGKTVCKFSLAVQRRFNREEADFLNIITWEKLAENCNLYLKKGSKAGVIGNIQTRSYENKEGIKVYVTEIIADEVEFLSTKDKEEESVAPFRGQQQSFEKSKKTPISQLEPDDSEDSLPF